MSEHVIVCLGDLLVDIVARLEHPLRRGTDAFASTSLRRGGSAANVASSIARNGGRARFVGAVGDDLLGRFVVDELVADGVDTCVSMIAGSTTGTVIVLVEPDGERTMAPDRGASAHIAPVDASWLDGATALHVPLYAFRVEPVASTARALVALAHERNVAVSVDLSASSLLDEFTPSGFVEVLAKELRPTIVFANEQEAPRAGAFFAAPVFVEKNGPGPVRVFGDARLVDEVNVPTMIVEDSTGAGDAFAAGFLTAFASERSRDPSACAASGIAAAQSHLRRH